MCSVFIVLNNFWFLIVDYLGFSLTKKCFMVPFSQPGQLVFFFQNDHVAFFKSSFESVFCSQRIVSSVLYLLKHLFPCWRFIGAFLLVRKCPFSPLSQPVCLPPFAQTSRWLDLEVVLSQFFVMTLLPVVHPWCGLCIVVDKWVI